MVHHHKDNPVHGVPEGFDPDDAMPPTREQEAETLFGPLDDDEVSEAGQLEEDLLQDLEHKRALAAREREQEQAAFRAKAERDESLANSMTEKQRAYIVRLRDGKQMLADQRQWLDNELEAFVSKSRASLIIEKLKALPDVPGKKIVNKPTPQQLPKGRYAIENEDGELRFYNVWRGTRKPDYIKVYVQHGPDESEVPFVAAMTICRKIVEAGPFDCARRYGFEIGACSNCGRRLTNRISRELGIGPVCGGRNFGDAYRSLAGYARERIIARGENPDEEIADE